MANKQMSYTRDGTPCCDDQPDDGGIGDGTLAAHRFELVKIAFKEALVNQANPNRRTREATAEMVATDVVGFADKVLAEMEKEPETNRKEMHETDTK